MVSLSASGREHRASKRSSLRSERDLSKGSSRERTVSKGDQTSQGQVSLAIRKISSKNTSSQGGLVSAFRTN